MTTPRRGAPFRSSSSARSAAQGTSRATSSVHLSQRERELTTFAETLNTRAASLRGAERRSNPFFLCAARWIASRSLSSGAHSRDPLARNDDTTACRNDDNDLWDGWREAIPIMLQTALMGFAKGSTHPALADLPPWQIKFVHSGCGKSTRRANHF